MTMETATNGRASSRKTGPLFVDASALAAELRKAIRGEVRFDAGSRALYATDGSNYRQVPIGVVIPRDVDDVVQTVAICRARGAPILSRGGGTSLTGGCCNVAVVMDWSKYLNKVLAIDPEKKLARVQPGTVLDVLRREAEKHHLTFAPDPSTHTHNTLGRDDRQQFVRGPFADGPGYGPDLGSGSRAGDLAVRRHADDRGSHD